MKLLQHPDEASEILETCYCNMLEKHPETLETQYHHVAMTYLVGNYGGAGLPFLPTTLGGWGAHAVLDDTRPHAPTVPVVGHGRGDVAESEEGAACRGRGGSPTCSSSLARSSLMQGPVGAGEDHRRARARRPNLV